MRHDLIAAVFALGDEDDLVRLMARVKALQDLVESDAGANLLAAYRRASNIVRIEEKKDGASYDGAADPAKFTLPEEGKLFKALEQESADRAQAHRERGIRGGDGLAVQPARADRRFLRPRDGQRSGPGAARPTACGCCPPSARPSMRSPISRRSKPRPTPSGQPKAQRPKGR